jgi:predicted nuclease with RNAse H fold
VVRAFRTFVGIDLGGARGKTTAVARVTTDDQGLRTSAVVQHVGTRNHRQAPWYDDALIELAAELKGEAVIAINAPLTLPACIRCVEQVCPGQSGCVDPAVVWLNTAGTELLQATAVADLDRVAATPSSGFGSNAPAPRTSDRNRPLLTPYTHRPTAVYLRHQRQIQTRETLGQGSGPITARATHLRRAFERHGFALNRNLIEVSPRATVHAFFGERKARGYKRDADPWKTRAEIVERLATSLRFSERSGLSREQVLRNDHCFDAVLAAYTAFLWARDGWEVPPDLAHLAETDGWIWVPDGPS